MNWRQAELGALVKLGGGIVQTGPFGSQLHQSDYVMDGTPVVMPKDIIASGIDDLSVARVGDDTASRLRRHRLALRTIVLPRRGDISKRAIVQPRQVGWLCGTGCIQIVVGQGDLSPEFLFYSLELHDVVAWLEQHAVGSTMLNLSASIVKKLPIRFPPKAQQMQIADALRSFDDLIENNRRRMSLLERAARELYQEWFVRLRFPGHEQARHADGLPEGWVRVPLGSLATKIGSGFTPRGGASVYLSDGTPLIRSQNVYDDSFDDDGLAYLSADVADSMSGVTVESRDILLNITGASVARCCMAPERYLPARVNQHVMIVRIDSTLADPFFVHRYINSDSCKRQLLSYAQKGSTREALTKSMVAKFDVTMPGTELMRQFGGIAADMFSQRENLASQNVKLRAARDLLLPRLMNGSISP